MKTQVLIIGGGATGSSLARDLALRGVDCVVVEKADLDSGASGANHGLLHSGARYAGTDPVSAMQCSAESRVLRQIAPHCIEETGGLFIALPGDDENFISGFQENCIRSGIDARMIAPGDAADLEPGISAEIIAACLVPDASINPFKLTVDTMAHACSLGARLLTGWEVTRISRRSGLITQVEVRRAGTGGDTMTIFPEQVVNAGGAWAGSIAELAGVLLPVALSKGTLLVTHSRVADLVVNRMHPPGSADIVVPAGSVSVIGTTSVPLVHPGAAHATFAEVDSLVAETSRMIPALRVTRYVRAFAGVRCLLAHRTPGGRSGKINSEGRELSRDFQVLNHASDGLENFTSVVGGKLTTCRLMAEKAADLVCSKLGINVSCSTSESIIPPGEAAAWLEPSRKLHAWIRRHDPNDTIICECRMIPLSAVNNALDHINVAGEDGFDLSPVSLRTGMGRGSCQGAFCAFRVCGHLTGSGLLEPPRAMDALRKFLQKRWVGIRPVLWGRQVAQEQLQEALHCGMFGMELHGPTAGEQVIGTDGRQNTRTGFSQP